MAALTITEICNTFFSKEGWRNFPESEKEKHAFNIIRFISIRYPMYVNMMNHKDMNPVNALDFWHSYLSPRIKSTPQWFWTTAGKKKEKVVKQKRLIDHFDKFLINKYCDFKCMNYKMLLDYYEMVPKETVADIKKYKELYQPDKKEE